MQFQINYKDFFRRLLPVKSHPNLRSSTSNDKLTFLVKRTVKQKLETGRLLMEKGCLQEAIQEYFAAVNLDPKCGISQFNLAYAFHEDGQYEQAREHYLKAIEIEPSCNYFLEHFARLNFETLDYAEAARLFHRASIIGAIQPISIGLWGRALFEQAFYEEAIEAFQQLLERDKQTTVQVGARFWLAVANIKLNNMAAARKIAETILRYKNADYKVLYELGENFIEARCISLARKIFEKIAIEREEFLLARLRLEDIRNLEKEIDDILPGLFDEDEERILYRIHALHEIGDDRVSKALITLIESSSPMIRESIIRYQIKFGYSVAENLLPLLKDPVDFVRDTAFEYFDKLDDPHYLNSMYEGISDHHVEIRKKAVRYVGRYASMEYVPELEMASTATENEEIYNELYEAISSIKKRYQKKIDLLFRACPGETTEIHEEGESKNWKFWAAIILQGFLISYFLYVLFFRW